MNILQIFEDNNLAIQQEVYSCGPVSLLNVLRLKSDFSRTEKELILLCKAEPSVGTSNENLKKAAAEVGLKIKEEKHHASNKDIERNIDDGAFVIVNYLSAYSGHGHYSVVTDYDAEAIYLRDCSYGFFSSA